VVIGFDLGSDQVKLLTTGAVDALVGRQPYRIGNSAMAQAVASFNDKSTTQSVEFDPTVLTASGIKDPASAKLLYKQTCA
jgi:ribose transport system substrate-binding protein